VNAFADLSAPSPQLSIEELVRRDPDVLIVGTRMAERFATDTRWRQLRAVRERRLILPDTGIVGRPGVRMGEAARHLRDLLRPIAPVAP
jgi:ABC-type Fe3+-hydroxamate transport system substrate-binding protein